MVWSKKLFKEQARSQTQTELTDFKKLKIEAAEQKETEIW